LRVFSIFDLHMELQFDPRKGKRSSSKVNDQIKGDDGGWRKFPLHLTSSSPCQLQSRTKHAKRKNSFYRNTFASAVGLGLGQVFGVSYSSGSRDCFTHAHCRPRPLRSQSPLPLRPSSFVPGIINSVLLRSREMPAICLPLFLWEDPIYVVAVVVYLWSCWLTTSLAMPHFPQSPSTDPLTFWLIGSFAPPTLCLCVLTKFMNSTSTRKSKSFRQDRRTLPLVPIAPPSLPHYPSDPPFPRGHVTVNTAASF